MKVGMVHVNLGHVESYSGGLPIQCEKFQRKSAKKVALPSKEKKSLCTVVQSFKDRFAKTVIFHTVSMGKKELFSKQTQRRISAQPLRQLMTFQIGLLVLILRFKPHRTALL